MGPIQETPYSSPTPHAGRCASDLPVAACPAYKFEVIRVVDSVYAAITRCSSTEIGDISGIFLLALSGMPSSGASVKFCHVLILDLLVL